MNPKRFKHFLQDTDKTLGKLVIQNSRLNQVFTNVIDKIDPSIRDHCKIASFKNNILLIHTDSSIWASKLRYYTSDILNILHDETNYNNIKSIRIKVIPETPLITTNKKPAYLSTTSALILKKLAESINDPKLRDSFLKIARHTKR